MSVKFISFVYLFVIFLSFPNFVLGSEKDQHIPKLVKEIHQTSNPEKKVDLYNELSYALMAVSPRAMDSIARIALAEAKEIDYIKGQSIAYKNIGIAKGKSGVPMDTVFRYNSMSITLAKQINDYYTIAAILNNNGIGYQYNAMYSKALKNLHKAYEIHSKHLPEDKLRVLILNNIGSIYTHLGEDINANKFYSEGYSLAKKLNKPELIIPNIDDFCLNLLNTGDTIQATFLIHEYIPKLEEKNSYLEISKLKILLARIYANQGLLQKALKEITEIEVDQNFKQYTVQICELSIFKTQVLLSLNRIDEARQTVQKNVSCSQQLQSKELIIEATNNELNLSFYEGNLAKTKELNQKYIDLLKEKLENEKIFFSQNLNAKFEEKIEIQRLNEAAVQRESILNILIGSSIGLLFFTLLAIRLQIKYKNANSNLELKNKEIVEAQHELNLKNQELQKYIESNIQLEQFAHIAAHDLKSPLRVLSSFTGLLKRKTDQKLNHKEKEYFKYIEDSAKQMSLLVQDLLDYSKANSQVLSINKIDLESFLSEIISMLQLTNSIDSEAITIEDCKKIIYADPIKLKQVFQNLLSNSLKFTAEDQQPKIKIASTESSDYINFSIQDNGIGIPNDYKEMVFNSFTQLNPNKFDGSGIGLSICKKIIDRHEGDIVIKDNEPHGTIINFSISKHLIHSNHIDSLNS